MRIAMPCGSNLFGGAASSSHPVALKVSIHSAFLDLQLDPIRARKTDEICLKSLQCNH
jgi:hypothetical protein